MPGTSAAAAGRVPPHRQNRAGGRRRRALLRYLHDRKAARGRARNAAVRLCVGCVWQALLGCGFTEGLRRQHRYCSMAWQGLLLQHE